jgi:tellurite resistance protein
VPPTFFAIPLGLAGLANAWHTATSLFGAPSGIGDALYLVCAVVYLHLVGVVGARLVLRPRSVVAELLQPALAPFYAPVPITGMLLALGLAPYARGAAGALFVVFLAMTVLFGGWLTGQWIAVPPEQDSIHPGYYLPTVAGFLIGGQVAAAFGLTALGWMSFGIGVLSWLMLGSLILNRLFVRPSLPVALVPTLAIEVAPPAVAGTAYAALTGGRIDSVAYALAGYTLLMVLVQLRLLPLYRALPFAPSYWSFTFPYAAVAVDAMRWIQVEHPAGQTLLGCAVLAAITVLIGGIALRSLLALRQGRFLPAPAA